MSPVPSLWTPVGGDPMGRTLGSAQGRPIGREPYLRTHGYPYSGLTFVEP